MATIPLTFDLRGLRIAAAAGLAVGAGWRSLPVHPPLFCPLRETTGVPCPMCGMTRSVTAALRGDLGASLRFHPLGILLVVLAVSVLLAWRVPRVSLPPWATPLVLGVAALAWVWNLTLNPTFS